MIPISNRDFQILVEKLPVLLELIPTTEVSLRKQEDIRLLKQLHRKLTRLNNKLNSNQNEQKRHRA